MAFNATELKIIAYAPAATPLARRAIAVYSTNDAAAIVEGAGYFNAAVTHLPLGSQILVGGDLDGTPFQKAYVVSANSGTAVTITPAATVSYANQQRVNGRVLCTNGTYGVVAPAIAGTISKIETVEVDGGITTNNAVLTFRIGTTNITDGVVTVATAGSAAGVRDAVTPSAANVLAATDVITVVVSGTPGGAKSVEATFVIDPS